jgi:hypothetical protein
MLFLMIVIVPGLERGYEGSVIELVHGAHCDLRLLKCYFFVCMRTGLISKQEKLLGAMYCMAAVTRLLWSTILYFMLVSGAFESYL